MENLEQDMRWIPKYEGIYAVDKKGNIHTQDYFRKTPKIVNYVIFRQNSQEYLLVNLTNRFGRKKTYLAARLVLKTWKEPPTKSRKWVVEYVDGNRHNLALDNLYWTQKRGKPTAKAEPVELWKDNKIQHSFRTITEAARFLKHSHKVSDIKKYYLLGEELRGYKIILPKREKLILTYEGL